MAITISGENNNDRILASDGVIDQISGINFSGIITASHINVGSNIQLGNAGIVTATTFIGNLTGNVNSTSPLLLQTGGSERFRITGNNELGIAGANYGSSGQVLTSGGSGSAVSWTTIPTQVTIANNADNRVITGGSGVNLNGEANLTFDGTNLKIGNAGTDGVLRIRGAANSTQVSISDNTSATLRIKTATGALGQIFVESGQSLVLGTDNTERLRIASNGQITTRGASGTMFNNAGAGDFGSFLTINGGHTANQWGILSLEGNTTSNGYPVGQIQFINQNNANGSSGASVQSRMVARIDSIISTSDSNASDDSGGHLRFFTKQEGVVPTEKLRITGTGSVNIGGDYTQTSSKLKVTGTVTVDGGFALSAGSFTAPGGFSINSGNVIISGDIAHDADSDTIFGFGAGADTFRVQTSGSERLRITSSGTVNIGGDYTSTTSRLRINSTSYPETTEYLAVFKAGVANGNRFKNRYIKIRNNYTGSAHGGVPIVWETNADGSNNKAYGAVVTEYDGSIRFLNAAATSEKAIGTDLLGTIGEKLRIRYDGNVGINETAPQEKLQIAGNISLGNRGDNTSRYIGKGTNGSGGVIGDSSANANSSWIGFISGSGTGQEDQLRFATHKSGVSGGERMRIDGEGIVKIKEKLVILNGGGFSETAPQGLSVRNGGIYLEQGNDITWNNGDNSISGESGYHLSFKTYDNVNSNATKQRFKIEGGQWSRLYGRNRFDQEHPLVNTTGSIAHPDFTTNSKSNLSVGWYTIAVNGGNRASARFNLIDRAGSRHSSYTFYASHHYGGAREQNAINVIHAGGRHSGNPIDGIRIKASGTYDGCMLQVYIGDQYNQVMASMAGDNMNTNGWIMKDWIADGTDPGSLNNFNNVNSGGEAAYANLTQIDYGGMSCDGNFIPAFDNSSSNLGTSSRRWVRVYAGDSSINTSDENLKQDITTLTTAEMNAAKRLSKLFVTYKWKKSVSEKGDKARTHTGIIAQRVKAEMVAAGLDPTKYSFYCEDDKYTMPDGTEVNLKDENITDAEVVDDNHVPSYVQPPGSTKSTVYSICYTELLAFIAAYNEQRFTSIESRLAALESS